MTNVLRKSRFKEARNLTETQEIYLQSYLDRSVPEKHKIATERALYGQLPRSGAIKIKCLQCTNYDREEIRNCSVLSCALHAVRPYRGKDTDVDLGGDESDNAEA